MQLEASVRCDVLPVEDLRHEELPRVKVQRNVIAMLEENCPTESLRDTLCFDIQLWKW